jgi:hypothetical protein
MTRGDDSPVASITIDALDPEEQRLWQTVAAVAERLGEDERWCLVGGLMVALFSIQEAQTPRVTTDIHVLANARARPSGTTWATQRLEEMGATLCKVDGVDGQRGFRFELDGQIIDVVAPDGFGKAATTAGKLETIQIMGVRRRSRARKSSRSWLTAFRRGCADPHCSATPTRPLAGSRAATAVTRLRVCRSRRPGARSRAARPPLP